MAGDVSRVEQMEGVKNFCDLLESKHKDRYDKGDIATSHALFI
jgi:hypothetical protein